ncbi:hypothetical protein HGD85_01505 [Rhodobacteraceae bacterium R_SAG10]|nr:hypothetical protein [Rhodobacteraceae bacterium R_SAG10]
MVILFASFLHSTLPAHALGNALVLGEICAKVNAPKLALVNGASCFIPVTFSANMRPGWDIFTAKKAMRWRNVTEPATSLAE